MRTKRVQEMLDILKASRKSEKEILQDLLNSGVIRPECIPEIKLKIEAAQS